MHETANTGEIKSLTGLRGIAACFVVLYHYFQGMDANGPAGDLLRRGYLSVDLFFVLSGFVTGLSYARAFAAGFSSRAYIGFIYKRLGRIYPLYLVVTLAAIVIAAFEVQGSPSLAVTASNLLLVQAWGIADSIVAPTWSISTEWAAYLAFPVFVALAINGSWQRCALAAGVSVAVLVFVATRSDAQIHEFAGIVHRNGPMDVFAFDTPYLLMRCLAGFTLGLAAYRLAASPGLRVMLRRKHLADIASAAVLILLLIPGSDVVLILAFVPLVICLSTGTSLAARVMGHGVVYWLGVVSYSIYLDHVVLENLLRRPVMDLLAILHIPHGFTLAAILLLGPLLALSAATYYGIEKPARAWSRRFVGTRRQVAI